MPNETFDVCCVYIPKSGLTLFEQPHGPVIGKLELGELDNNKEAYSAYMVIGDNRTEFDYTNLYMVGYETMAIAYKNYLGSFIQIENGYWLNLEELLAKQLTLKTWMNYVIEKDTEWYANDPGLNLREGPSTDFKKIATMKGDLWGIKPTKETNGNWCKVTVTHYREHPCSGGENLIIETFSGWVKLISDEQMPNVWDYGKGC